MDSRPEEHISSVTALKFSFIIPALITKPYLVEAVESVLAQTVGFKENIQIVLVSSSQTNNNEITAVCENYRKRFPNNIILIDLADSTPGAAYNSGLKAATGCWINFLEPGDKWDPDACEAAFNFFDQHPEINVICFPITLFGTNKGAHWLNFKFTETKVANIFNTPDCVVLDLCSCFCARKAVEARPFGDGPSTAEEVSWIAQLLLDEQSFGLVAKTHCHCRSPRSSAAEIEPLPPSRYAEALRHGPLAILRHAQEKYSEIPEWGQHAAMLELNRYFRKTDQNALTPVQKEQCRELMRNCLEQIDDHVIRNSWRNLWPEERLLTLALKNGASYGQMKELVKPDKESKKLLFYQPGDKPVLFSQTGDLWLEFMDIAGGQLLLRGSCAVLVSPLERIKLFLTAISPDNKIREYPCELIRRSGLKRRRFFMESDFWPREGFELVLPLAGTTEIRAFVEIDGLRFDMKWLHKQKSPFVRNGERLYWERAGFAVSPLSDGNGLHIETRESHFLFSFVIPAYNVKQYLAEAIESIIAQTIGFEENIQIVLVNDGSTDSTGAMCKHYQNLWPENIVYIEKPNGGLSSARNTGARAATGRYINFLDGDDKWEPNVCEIALDFFEKNPEVSIICFPILFFERRKGAHYLNYKFRQTRVANIFNDTDYALHHVNTCFIQANVAKSLPFDEELAISEDMPWLCRMLLDEQNFGVIAKPNYLYRKRFDHSSILDTKMTNLSYYLVCPRLCFLNIIDYAKEKYGEIPRWAQYDVMSDLAWRIKEADNNFLTSIQKNEYRKLIHACLAQLDDQIICAVRNLSAEERLCALALKYDMSYEQIKAWVILDEENGVLCFHHPDAQPLKLTDIPALRLEFMDIVDDRLLLRGSCFTLIPPERMSFALEMELLDGRKREYPCKLYRRADRKKHSFFEDEIWGMESFELSLPLVDQAKVQAFVSTDGIRFNLKWQHEKLSPFFRGNDASYLARSGYIIGKLPNDMGFQLETLTSNCAQKHERALLRSIARQQTDLPSNLTARIRQAARRMRRLSKKPIWLISDRIAFAGDNGEALFEYLMAAPEIRKEIHPLFVLSKDSPDWKRLKQIGPTVPYGSVLHKILFLAADKIISSSADNFVINPVGKDDWMYRGLFNFDFVFLQHGVILHDLSLWLCKSNKNIALFVTSAKREWASVVKGDYGYIASQLLQSGLPRHDKLLRKAAIEKQQRLIAVMPTWRDNLVIARDSVTTLSLPNPAFKASEYFQFWNGLLNHPRLLEALREQNYRLRFAIHPQSTYEGSKFKAPEPVEIAFHCDYPQTFCEAALLLTDYSSVAFDFALLRKPLIYAHFDYDTFYSGHIYDRGYFDYDRDGFGPVCPDLETTVDMVIRFLENGCAMEPLYRKRIDAFFGVQPENRCQTVVDAIKKLGRRPE